MIGSVGEGDMQLTTLGRGRAQRSFIQDFLHCDCTILRRIDKRDFASEHACNRDAKQRIMGAAKHERVDPVGKQGLKITDDRLGELRRRRAILLRSKEPSNGHA